MNQSRCRNLGWQNQRRGGSGSVDLSNIGKTLEITQNLNNGDNSIVHNLGFTIDSFSVKNGNDFIEVTGDEIDLNTFNINLAGGGVIANATIILIYR